MKKTFAALLITTNILCVNAQNQLVDSNNDFTFKIYKATKTDTSNLFISPFSLNIALSVANEGARTSTRQEMDKLLSIRNMKDRASVYNELIKRTVNLKDSAYNECLEWRSDKSGENAIYLANSLWINQEFPVDDIYKKTIEENYYSEIFGFHPDNISNDNKKLIDWISAKTNNKISNISGLNKDVMLSIINAIYFMGEWDVPFDRKKTKEKKFRTIEKKKIKLDFMRDQAYYQYYEDNDIQGIFLPYKCHQFSMIVILPKERYGISKIEDKLSSEYLTEINRSGMSHEVILSLPKFKIESEIFPVQDIVDMGYTEMFSDKADFTGISSDSLKIGNIIHKTFIEVDEKKTEAAAVSRVDMVMIGYGGGGNPPPPPPPKIFNADHPFIFLIYDNRIKAILFIGRFVKE